MPNHTRAQRIKLAAASAAIIAWVAALIYLALAS